MVNGSAFEMPPRSSTFRTAAKTQCFIVVSALLLFLSSHIWRYLSSTIPILNGETTRQVCSKRNIDLFCSNISTVEDRYVGQSYSSPRFCGLCNQNLLTAYLQNVSIALQKKKGQECSELVVYGTAFGSKFKDLFDKDDWGNPNLQNLIITVHKRCFFAFVLAENEDQVVDESLLANITPDGLEYLIPIPKRILPYSEMRRNTKIFKMYGQFLFSVFSESGLVPAMILVYRFTGSFW